MQAFEAEMRCPADVRAPALKQSVRRACPPRRSRPMTSCSTYARRNGITCHHASRTGIMGSDAMALVDDKLRVHGI